MKTPEEILAEAMREALNHAVSALYFGDNSDYLSALQSVVSSLTGNDDIDEAEINRLFKSMNPECDI